MASGFDIDLSDVEYKVAEFVRRYPADARLLLRDQMRLLVQTIIKWQPPPTYSAGRSAVRADLNKQVCALWNEEAKFDTLMVDAGNSKDGFVYRKMANPPANFQTTAWGNVTKIPANRLDFDGSKIYAMNRRVRNRRGRASATEYYVTSKRVLNKLVSSVQKRVGNLKRGWREAAAMVNAKIPDFALRAESGTSGAASGSGTTGEDAQGPWMEIANTTPYIRDEGNMVRRAVEMREKDVAEHLEKRLAKIIAQAGLA